jgi:hypothetical protein
VNTTTTIIQKIHRNFKVKPYKMSFVFFQSIFSCARIYLLTAKVNVVFLKPLVTHSLGLEFRHRLCILLFDEAIQLAYGPWLVLLRCPFVPHILRRRAPEVFLERRHMTYTVYTGKYAPHVKRMWRTCFTYGRNIWFLKEKNPICFTYDAHPCFS